MWLRRQYVRCLPFLHPSFTLPSTCRFCAINELLCLHSHSISIAEVDGVQMIPVPSQFLYYKYRTPVVYSYPLAASAGSDIPIYGNLVGDVAGQETAVHALYGIAGDVSRVSCMWLCVCTLFVLCTRVWMCICECV